MDDINFRRNVDPAFRRQTNKSLAELNSLQAEYESKKNKLHDADGLLSREKDRMDDRTIELENARNDLSEAQSEIDSDYLPEGAQPRARIQKRDEYIVSVQQCEAAFEAQKKATHAATELQLQAERDFFLADRTLNRFAEGLEDVLQAKAVISGLDKEKYANSL
jgi:FKBP-type peptidyl-prolyl cis-trans isomerase